MARLPIFHLPIGNGRYLLLVGAAGLALEPLLWLVRSWLDPVYGGLGLPVALLCAALLSWSLLSPGKAGRPDLALALLGATALLRLGGVVLAVNTIGALALVVDVYALGLWAGLHRRQRPVSPGWLAVLFAFSLPLERVLQRLVGFPLQQLSAQGACTLLDFGLGPVPVVCQGVRIVLAGRDVLVDLPCSGSRTLLMVLVLLVTLAAVNRPGPGRALVGLGITLLSAWLANSLRIAVLALGIAFPGLLGVNPMEQPWHELIGALSLGLAMVPVLLWSRRIPRRAPQGGDDVPLSATGKLPATRLGVALLALALVLPWLPQRPVDVARRASAPILPAVLMDLPARPASLRPQERAYFNRYGGAAARAWYGELGLTLVRTSAPLRHLHAPDECLSGLGHQVEYRGRIHGSLPTAVYRSTDPQGRVWRVSVSFVSEHGQYAASVAEAVWHWWQRPGTWTQVQRITPWETDPAGRAALEGALRRALELPLPEPGNHPLLAF